MAAPSASSLSQVCRKIADFVKAGVNHESLDMTNHSGHEHNVEQVTIGSPALVTTGGQPEDASMIQRLNLFFYRFEPFEFDADILPGETWLLRTHCLITPFAVSEDNISAGENDLRLIGEVMRVFHETPVQTVRVDDDGKDTDFFIQAIFEPLSTESMNQVWSTQGSDTIYRPSVSYEISLAPVLPVNKAVDAPLVGATGFQTDGSMDRAKIKLTGVDYSDIVQTPIVNKITVNTAQQDWAPVIYFMHDNKYTQSLVFSVKPSQVDIKVAGEKDDELKLYWDVWDKTNGWQPRPSEHQVHITDAWIDPNQPASSDLSLAVPIGDTGQAVLFAERSYRRIPEEPEQTVRSNLLLLTVYDP